jgi:histone acetyltransferase (RNA polymerase elongator complex component)
MKPAVAVTPAGRPLIIPLFIPHMGCPHQCVFCNQQSITGKAAQTPTPEQIHREVNRFLKYGKKRPSTTQISFFGGSFLGLEKETILSLLGAAMPFVQRTQSGQHPLLHPTGHGQPETLDLMDGFPVSTVEIGVQSMNDRVLDAAGRGHRAADTVVATGLLEGTGLSGGPADDGGASRGRRCRRHGNGPPDGRAAT